MTIINKNYSHLKKSLAIRIGQGFFVLILFLVGLFSFSAHISKVSALTAEELRVELKEKLGRLQNEINDLEQKTEEEKKKADSLKREINIISSQIKKTDLEIQRRSIEIGQLGEEITDRKNQIGIAEKKIDYQKDALAGYIRKIYESDQLTILEIILQNDKLSDFFNEINSYENIHDYIKFSLNEIQKLKNNLVQEKNNLEDERNEEANLKKLQEYQKKALLTSESNKNQLLKQTKGNEKTYQQIIAEKAKDLKAIRNQLYALEGFGISMTFEIAYGNAKAVSDAVGIRPAFLLGLLKVESNWGSNLGSGNWRIDMYECYKKLGKFDIAESQKAAFLSITSRLGLNPDMMPVSKEPYYGCGGAMGVAQFMPTTWIAYESKIASITGNNPPSPWQIKDGFAAAAIKLANDGATSKNYTGERMASLKYLAGANWQKPSVQWYWSGNYGVKYYEDQYQEWIDRMEELER